MKKARKYCESQGLNKSLEQLNIETLALSSTCKQISAATTTSDTTMTTALTTPNTEELIEEKLSAIVLDANQPVTNLNTPTLTTAPAIAMSTMTSPLHLRSRRSSSSTTIATTTADTSTIQMKTRSASKLDLIEDEADSNKSIPSVTTQVQGNNAIVDAANSADNDHLSTTTCGVNRRTSVLFKRNKSNLTSSNKNN